MLYEGEGERGRGIEREKAYLSNLVLPHVEAFQVWPELAAVCQVQLCYGIAVELEVLQATGLPDIRRREEGEVILSGIHCADTEEGRGGQGREGEDGWERGKREGKEEGRAQKGRREEGRDLT